MRAVPLWARQPALLPAPLPGRLATSLKSCQLQPARGFDGKMVARSHKRNDGRGFDSRNVQCTLLCGYSRGHRALGAANDAYTQNEHCGINDHHGGKEIGSNLASQPNERTRSCTYGPTRICRQTCNEGGIRTHPFDFDPCVGGPEVRSFIYSRNGDGGQ